MVFARVTIQSPSVSFRTLLFEGMAGFFNIDVELGVKLMMPLSGFSRPEHGISALKVPTRCLGDNSDIGCVLRHPSGAISSSMALSVSGGDASSIIGASDNAVAWTTLQSGWQHDFTLSLGRLVRQAQRACDWLLCVIIGSVVV